jgi:hypothetical protein
MQALQISEATAARRRIPIYLVDATDGFTPEVGVVTPTIEVSKNGAVQAAGGGTWTEIGDGLYYYETTAGEVDTLGFLNVRVVKSAVSREFQGVVQVVAWDPYFDFTANLDAAVSSRESTAAAAARETNILAAIAALNDLSIADVQTALTNQGYTSVRAALLDNLDDSISNVRADIAALNDLSQTDVQAAMTAQGYTVARAALLDNLDAAISTVVTVIAALNNISIADVQTALTAQGYTGARAANLDNLDAAISSVVAAIAALNDLSSADVDTAITANAVVTLLRKALTNKRVTNPTTGRLEIWNDATSAVEFTIPIFENVAETQAYRGQGIDVQEKIV